jgi:dienelactone hydrolase
VGVRTASIGRLTVEIVYPAAPGSTVGVPEATYDVRDWLPPQERSKVPDANSPAVTPIGGSLYRDVPIDTQHGPYPVVVFVHGTASFRVASGSVNGHWASRGFVVLAADYPGLFLTDQLNSACLYPTTGAQDIPGDIDLQMQALKNPAGDLAFLAGHIDMTRLGLSGHSQGACVTATLTTLPGVQIVLPMSGSAPVTASPSLKSIAYISGMADTVIGYNFPLIGNVVCPLGSSSTTGAYQASPGPTAVTKRLVGITGGGHLVPTDLCQTNQLGRNAVQEAQADGVCGINTAVIIGLPALFDCGTIALEKGIEAVNYASTAALEETLHCKDRSAAFASLRANVPQVGEFLHAP